MGVVPVQSLSPDCAEKLDPRIALCQLAELRAGIPFADDQEIRTVLAVE